MTTVLLDTNVLIEFEDTNRELPLRDADILRNAKNFDFFVHPLQLGDIDQDKDELRKQLLLSRIRQFRELNNPDIYDKSFFDDLGWRCTNRNDFVDNNLLICVWKPVVDYLVTEDKDIHKKADKVSIGERVLTIDGLYDLVVPFNEPSELAYIVDEPCSKLDVRDSFFDSLRKDYGSAEFDAWFENKCARGQRQCWCINYNGEPYALCIYKKESNEILDDEGFSPGCQVLKLCTFKVSPKAQGSRVGERLLHQAFKYAWTHGLDFVYFTVFEDRQKHLVRLAQSFGFENYGIKPDTGERVLGKYLRPQNVEGEALGKFEYVRKYYPSYKDDESVSKYIIPIHSRWHEILFPDISEFRDSLFGNDPSMYRAESNTIRKAYLCHSNTRTIEPGDILLFYRSQDRHSIQVLAVVDQAERLRDIEKIREMTRKRTVYTDDQIKEELDSSKELLVICFSVVKYLYGHPVSRDMLESFGISVPQSIVKLDEERYSCIKKVING